MIDKYYSLLSAINLNDEILRFFVQGWGFDEIIVELMSHYMIREHNKNCERLYDLNRLKYSVKKQNQLYTISVHGLRSHRFIVKMGTNLRPDSVLVSQKMMDSLRYVGFDTLIINKIYSYARLNINKWIVDSYGLNYVDNTHLTSISSFSVRADRKTALANNNIFFEIGHHNYSSDTNEIVYPIRLNLGESIDYYHQCSVSTRGVHINFNKNIQCDIRLTPLFLSIKGAKYKHFYDFNSKYIENISVYQITDVPQNPDAPVGARARHRQNRLRNEDFARSNNNTARETGSGLRSLLRTRENVNK